MDVASIPAQNAQGDMPWQYFDLISQAAEGGVCSGVYETSMPSFSKPSPPEPFGPALRE